MNRRHFIGASAVLALNPMPAWSKPINIDHSAKVHAVDQMNANLCWLAAAAMLVSERRGEKISMAALARELGEPFSSRHTDGQTRAGGGALDIAQLQLLASKLGAGATGWSSFDTKVWVDMIALGPLLVIGYPENGSMGHAVLITGLAGEPGKPEELLVRQIDPAGGITTTRKFGELIRFYEGLAQAGALQLIQYSNISCLSGAGASLQACALKKT